MKIPKLFIVFLYTSVIWLVFASVTLASPITFTFTGTGSGTVNAVPFTNAVYTVTLKGDTAAITFHPNDYSMVATTMTMAIAGFATATVTEFVSIFDNQQTSLLGISRNVLGDMFDIKNTAFATYALATPLGPINLLPGLGNLNFKNLQTNLGPITVSDLSSITFQSVFGSPPVTWSGNVSIPFQITSVSVDSSGNAKFHKSSSSLTGTMELYISDTGPQRSTEGCYVKLEGTDGSKICVDQITNISTDVQKSKSDQGLLVGTGTMTTMVGGVLSPGIAYLDVKETFKKDNSGGVITISLNGKIAGGTDDVIVLTGNVKSTLTK